MKHIGKTIQIYCPSGDPRGVRIAEITTSVPQAILVPRTKLEEATGRQELARVGMYFLFGPTEDGADEQVYVGEADDCAKRLVDHSKAEDKRFWQVAIAVVSSKSTLTKGHGRLLEHWAIEEARKADRYFIANGTTPKKPPIPEAMEAECGEIFDVAGTLLTTLGYPVFDALLPAQAAADTESDRRHVFMCNGKGYSAKMLVSDAGYVVLQGSVARLEIADSVKGSIEPKRTALVQHGVLEQTAEGFVFLKNHAFKTPSAGANLIGGTSSNGWDAWVDADGRTLDQIMRKEANT